MMEPLRTWTIEGEQPLTLNLYRPALTIRFGDGPEATLSPDQVATLSQRFIDIECYFHTEEPTFLKP
jgi:hypothetical protein